MNFIDNMIVTAQCKATVYGGFTGMYPLADILLVDTKEEGKKDTISDGAINDALNALNGKEGAKFKKTDVFSEVTNTGGGVMLELKDLLLMLGIMLLVIVAMKNLIKYGSSSSGQKIDESKEGIGRAAIALLGVAAIMGIATLILGVGAGLFSTSGKK